MSDLDKLALLRAIATDVTPGNPTRLSFHSLSKTVDFTKEQMETMLKELNKDRFISQFAKKGVDGFLFTLNQKGLDAVQDESFI